MPRHAEQRIVPYSPAQMFDLVADVGAYPQFLPWVVGARVRSSSPMLLVADLIVGFKVFRETFTSRVTLERPHHVHVDYVNGPLKHLHNDWRFTPDGQGGTRVDFHVDFAFKNRLLEAMVGTVFSEALGRMVAAFEARAAELYASETLVTDASSSSATRTA